MASKKEVKILKFLNIERDITDIENKRNNCILKTFIKEEFNIKIERIIIPDKEAFPIKENKTFDTKLKEYKKDEKGKSIFIDVSDYQTRGPLYDYIVPTLYEIAKKQLQVIFLVKSLEVPLDSESIKNLAKKIIENNIRGKIIFISLSGKIRYIGKKLAIENISLPKEINSQADFKKRIETLSNAWSYNHYILPKPSNVHIRNLIDLSYIISDDSLCRYIIEKVNSIKKESNFNLIVGFGLCSDAINELGGILRAKLNDCGYAFFNSQDTNLIRAEVKEGRNKILLLSDIMYSGNTARHTINLLKKIGTIIEKVAVIISAENAPEWLDDNVKVESCVKLHLSYKKTESNCDLCKITYPKIYCSTIKPFSLSHFIPVNSYDFWDIIKTSGALEIGHHQGASLMSRNHYFYYINTLKIFQRKGDWIAFLMSREIEKTIIKNTKIDYLVFPKEEAAQFLSSLLIKQLNFPKDSLLPVTREHIEEAVPTEVSEVVRKQYSKIRDKNILIIDDCVNTLNTFDGLKNIVDNLGATIKGHVFFLNRLDFRTYTHWETQKQFPKIYFYHFPSPPWDVKKCPLCQNKQI